MTSPINLLTAAALICVAAASIYQLVSERRAKRLVLGLTGACLFFLILVYILDGKVIIGRSLLQ